MLVNRLLPSSRPEYNDFLRWNNFDPADPPEPLVLLQRSEGIKQTDAIEVFPCPVPDNLTRLMRDCLNGSVNLFVQRVNPDAPSQQRLLCRMHGCWPVDFSPCSGSEFESIPKLELV